MMNNGLQGRELVVGKGLLLDGKKAGLNVAVDTKSRTGARFQSKDNAVKEEGGGEGARERGSEEGGETSALPSFIP